MPKLPKNKARLDVLIDKEVMKKFRELVKMKHELLHGALSYEVEEALKHWILEHTRTQSLGGQAREQAQAQAQAQGIEASKYNPPPRYLKVWLQVKEYLESALKYDFEYTHHLLHEDLVRAVAAVRGSDERTLRKWPRVFEECGILKRISPKLYEVKVS
jgi:hypothetical protein